MRHWYKAGRSGKTYQRKVADLKARAASQGFEVFKWEPGYNQRLGGRAPDGALQTPATASPGVRHAAGLRPAKAKGAARFLNQEAEHSSDSEGSELEGLSSVGSSFLTDNSHLSDATSLGSRSSSVARQASEQRRPPSARARRPSTFLSFSSDEGVGASNVRRRLLGSDASAPSTPGSAPQSRAADPRRGGEGR